MTEIDLKIELDEFEDEVEIDDTEIKQVLSKKVKKLSDSEVQKLEIQLLIEFDNFDSEEESLEKTGSKIDDYYIKREFLENKIDDLYALHLKYAEVDGLDRLLTKEINRSTKKLNKLIERWG